MKILVNTILGSLIIGYFIGCINLSFIISKIKGFDIRHVGSGNAGASNLVIVFGKKIGLTVAVLDILKSFLAFRLAEYLFPDACAGVISYAGVAGPILRFGCTPTVAPVSLRASEQAAAPQCQKVIVFSASESETGSPKNTG